MQHSREISNCEVPGKGQKNSPLIFGGVGKDNKEHFCLAPDTRGQPEEALSSSNTDNLAPRTSSGSFLGYKVPACLQSQTHEAHAVIVVSSFGGQRKTLVIPTALDGKENQQDWGSLFTKLDPWETAQARKTLKMLQAKARTETSKMICNATELRDIGISCFPNGAPGNDGLPSNVIRSLPFAAYLFFSGRCF